MDSRESLVQESDVLITQSFSIREAEDIDAIADQSLVRHNKERMVQ